MACGMTLSTTTLQNSTPCYENKLIGVSSFPANEYSISIKRQLPSLLLRIRRPPHQVLACSSPPPPSASPRFPKTRLYVSGLSFRTTEESLRNAFQNFGQLVEVNLVMDKLANRPRGFAFLRYATEEESLKAIEGMHGKFLDGRVIFVEIAKSRAELRQSFQHKQF